MHSLYALHGFLGTPQDWDPFLNSFRAKFYATELSCTGRKGFYEWAHAFNRRIAPDPESKILLGYSLGGRLAMHALLENPDLWNAAIIVSANPGLPCKRKKEERLASDIAWSKKFLEEPWESLMKQWNAREALATSTALARREEDYSREELSRHLVNLSLGNQEDLSERLAKIMIPILWMAGENDPHYAMLAKNFRPAHPRSKIWIAPNSGHRIPWDSPAAFAAEIARFIDSIQ